MSLHRPLLSRPRSLVAMLAAILLAAMLPALASTTASAASSAPDPISRPPMAYLASAPGALSPNDMQAFLSAAPGAPPVQLTSNPAYSVGSVSLSADASFAVTSNFLSGAQGNEEDLYTVDVATKTSTRLATPSGRELYPQVSPDMQQVSYWHSDVNGFGSGIFVQSLTTGTARRVSSLDTATDGEPLADHASWSHDSTRVAFGTSNTNAGTQSLVVARADGTSRQTIITGPATESNFQECAWTPDDAYLICTNAGTDGQLDAISVATGASVQITHDPSVTFYMPQMTNDWVLYFVAINVPDGFRSVWLGDLSTIRAEHSDGFGESLASSGPVLPRPPGFAPVTPPPPPGSKPPGYKCGTVKFFGLRGSGEKNFEGEGMGKTVDSVKKTMANAITGLRFEAIDYPAIGVNLADPAYPGNYVTSMMEGRETLLKSVRDFIQFCPTTYAVIVGYSQGAHAAGDAYELLSDSERKHVASLVMFGDPVFNPKQLIIDRGDFDSRLSGIEVTVGGLSPRQIPRRWTPNVESYCTGGDPVCNYNKRNAAACGPLLVVGLCAHQIYINRKWTSAASIWATDHWRRMPHL